MIQEESQIKALYMSKSVIILGLRLRGGAHFTNWDP